MAFWPPSVTQAAPSGPTMTPCGAEPWPSGISLTSPLRGSSQPSLPAPCAVYQTPPSDAGATSCGREPLGTAYACTLGSRGGIVVGATSGWRSGAGDATAAGPGSESPAGVDDEPPPQATASSANTPQIGKNLFTRSMLCLSEPVCSGREETPRFPERPLHVQAPASAT